MKKRFWKIIITTWIIKRKKLKRTKGWLFVRGDMAIDEFTEINRIKIFKKKGRKK